MKPSKKSIRTSNSHSPTSASKTPIRTAQMINFSIFNLRRNISYPLEMFVSINFNFASLPRFVAKAGVAYAYLFCIRLLILHRLPDFVKPHLECGGFSAL